MATVANFTLIRNPNIVLPAGGEDFVDHFDVQGFAGQAILLFRYRANGGKPVLKIRINNNPERVALNLTANGDQSASFHETILANELTETNNEIKAVVTGTGSVTISDVMVLYQMTV